MKHQSVKIFSSVAVIFVLLAAQFVQIKAQTKTSPERGFNPGNSYSVSEIETISQQSGNLMLNVPLGGLPAGRGGMTAGVSLQYNSKLWDLEHADPEPPDNTIFESLFPSEDGGWRYAYEYRLKTDLNCLGSTKLYIVLPDGGQHLLWLAGNTDYQGQVAFVPDGTLNCSNPPTAAQVATNYSYFTLDGSFLRLELEGDNDANTVNNRWTLFLPDGSRIIHNPDHVAHPERGLLQRVIDRNGNSIDYTESYDTATPPKHVSTTITDQLNRSVVIEYEPDHANHPDRDLIHSKGTGGADVTTQVQWKTIAVRRTYKAIVGANNCSPYPCNQYHTTAEDFRVVDKIYLPAQVGDPNSDSDLFYSFDYNADATSNPSAGWGEISKVTLPSGAYSTYSYERSGAINSVPARFIIQNRPTQKTLNYLKEYDGASVLQTDTWTYASTNQGISASYTATAPDGSVSTEYDGSWDASAGEPGTKYAEGFQKPYKSVAGNGVTVERIYADNIPTDDSVIASANQFVKYELTSIPDNAGSLTKTAVREFSQDKNGNTTEVREYDFIPYSSVTRDSNGRITALPSNLSSSLKRITKTEYYNDTPDSSSTTYTDPDSYISSGNPRLLRLPKSMEVQNASAVPQTRSEMDYDFKSYSTNTQGGNVTETKSWDSYKGGSAQSYSNPLTSTNSITTSASYDGYGNPTQTTDANGVQTTLTYGNVSTGSGNVTGLYPTQTEAASNYSAVKRTSTAVYDFYTGLPTSTTDADNSVTNGTDYDDLGRPIKAKTAIGTSLESWTQTVYDDLNRRVIVKADLETKGDARKVATQFYDQLGRVRLSKTLEDSATQSATNETDGIKVQTRYQTTSGGYSYQLSSNPYRADYAYNETAATMGWTRSKSYKDGKHSEVETFSGASLPQPFLTTGYNTATTGKVQTDTDADRTLVTDQAGKQRISKTNALGQLTDVWEVMASSDSSTVSVTFPNQSLAYGYQTSYQYDTLNNLTTVNQPIGSSGGQSRTFSYSSLSRLKSANNPESGTISYTYDNNGNLATKTDARSIQTSYSYDALNRITQRSYANEPSGQTPTPMVTYTYDNVTNAKGRLTKVTTGSTSNPFSITDYQAFDLLGRVTQSQQTTDGTAYTAQTYTYNLSGALIEETYPSGRVVKNVLDNDGELSMVQSKKTSSAGLLNYAKHFTYTAVGAVSSMQLGNSKWESTQFNSRLQPTQIALGSTQNATDNLKLNFTYNTTGNADNNGNILTQTITVPTEVRNSTTYNGFTATQNYTYDSLNRIHEATETIASTQQWKQTFSYDRYGNRTFDEGNTTTLPKNCGSSPSFTVCTADRKVYNPTPNTSDNRLSTSDGYSFDLSGNTTRDAQSRKFTYDAENKQTKVETVDANGNPISTIGEYSYDGDGKRVKKYVPSTGETTIFVYDASGKMVAEYSTQLATTPQVSYLTADHLGSPRINTDANGAVIARHDYQPFGEEIQRTSYGADEVRKQFTSYERDKETDLDYAKARMFGSGFGRFTSPDPSLSSGRDTVPQSWNRYIYSLNNPLRFIDPLGLYEFDSSVDSTQQENFRNQLKEANKRLKIIRNTYGKDSDEYKLAKTAIDSYGCEAGSKGCNEKVGSSLVIIKAGKLDSNVGGTTSRNSTDTKVEVTFSANDLSNSSRSLVTEISHEGSHVQDDLNYINSGKKTKVTDYDSESKAYTVSSVMEEAVASSSFKRMAGMSFTFYDDKWRTDNSTLSKSEINKAVANERKKNIDALLAVPKSSGGLYGFTPKNPGNTYYP